MLQMQEQDKVPEELSELEISNLLNKEFKVIIINGLKELERRTNEHNENFNKELENIRTRVKEYNN